MYYSGTALTPGVYAWVFDTGGAYASAQAELLALRADSVILLRQSATRFQTITLTLAPTVSGSEVTVTGTQDRGASNQIPQGNGNIAVTVTPSESESEDIDQVARDAAATAQGEIDTHEASTHNTDTTARTAAATVQTELTAHEATPHGGGGGAGVDQTARDAAATAQGEIDTHEASTHNTDITAQSTALNARQTAEQAQTAIETHEASTHNTDTTARNASAAAQSTKYNAQGVWFLDYTFTTARSTGAERTSDGGTGAQYRQWTRTTEQYLLTYDARGADGGGKC